MSWQEKSSGAPKIDRKWVKESKRTFSVFPGLPRSCVLGEEEIWLELMEFYRDDLKWLLSLDHHKFWSHMIYSDKAHELLVSYLKGSPPFYMKNSILVRENMKNVYTDVERLVFLVFFRLSTEKESEGCYIRNFGDIIYNNYLFTVPIILDICLIYGTSNPDLVKKMINNVIASAPDFLDDFQEILPHFVKALKTVKEKFPLKCESVLEDAANLKLKNEIQDLIIYLSDSVATIQIFFELYPNVCQLFNKAEIVTEIISFYSNVLPDMMSYFSGKYEPVNEESIELTLIKNIRIDMLRIIKSVFDFVLNETNDILEKRDEKINEYLVLMMELLSEPTFLFDYNLIYSVEFEIECVVKNCDNVDSVKIDCILEGVAKAVNRYEDNREDDFSCRESDDNGVKLNSLVTEVKDIFPHLEESFIKQCLNYYNNNTENVIAAVLENHIPSDFNENEKLENIQVYKGKHKHKHRNLNEMLNDREEIHKIKEKYAVLSFVADDTYDDEYDDTYDDSQEVSIRDGYEIERRPFVVPRILRTKEETDEEDEGEEEEGDYEENFSKVNFVENPAIIRERMERARSERTSRDLVGRGRGRGQSRQVLKNREYKESHKSFVGNHNRRKQAAKKYSRGMIPS